MSAKNETQKVDKKQKQTKPKTSSHPPYFEMIKEALLALNERSGSSPYAISKYMEDIHKSVLPENFRRYLGLQLKNSAAKGKLLKIKASYKLSESGNKDKPAVAKKPKAIEAKKTKATESKTAKSGTKRKASGGIIGKKKVSTPVKKPKTIKSPVAKKAA